MTFTSSSAVYRDNCLIESEGHNAHEMNVDRSQPDDTIGDTLTQAGESRIRADAQSRVYIFP